MKETKHLNERQKPLPNLPWIMKQTWQDILFAHYPVNRESLEKLVPECLPLDTFDGKSWVTIVPYLTSTMQIRGLPPLPGMNHFAGFNVRTYVTVNGKPGVYFFNLIAENFLAAYGAKIAFKLPYVYRKIRMQKTNETIIFESGKKADDDTQLLCRYKSISSPKPVEQGSLEEFLVERYCLYTTDTKGNLFRGDILHQPWKLERAQAFIERNSLHSSMHIEPLSEEPIFHYAKKAVVRFWPLLKIGEKQPHSIR